MLAGMPTHLVVLTRDPFATCANWHLRVGAERITRNWGWAKEQPTDDASYFCALGQIWLRRARYLQEALAGDAALMAQFGYATRPVTS
jgi:hypothetical protein